MNQSILLREESIQFRPPYNDVNGEVFEALDLFREDIVCPLCDKVLADGKMIIYKNMATLPLLEFVGKTLFEVRAIYAKKIDAVYSVSDLVRNDCHIDRSPKYPGSEKPSQKNVVKNKNGWVCRADDYVVQEGDEAFFEIFTYFHFECGELYERAIKEEKLKRLFQQSGFEDVGMEPIAEQHSSSLGDSTWFKVYTQFGEFVIGMPEHHHYDGAVNIGWCDVFKLNVKNGKALSLETLFEKLFSEVDTKCEDGIYAKDLNEAENFLSRLYATLKGG